MKTTTDRRKPFTYRGVAVTPQHGAKRYFGARHGEYLTRWWLVTFGPHSWVLIGTKAEARSYIERYL